MLLDAGDRLADDVGEGMGGVAIDPQHLRHRQAGQIDAVEPGRDEQVAGLDVGIGGEKAQLELAGAGAEEDGAQPVADDLHRHRLVLVGDQGDLALQRVDARHLAEDAGFVDHRLAGDEVVLAALVDDDAAGKGIARLVEDFGDGAGHRLPVLHVEQRAQALVLQFQVLLAQQPVGRLQLLALELGVLLLQDGEAGKIAAELFVEVDRRVGGALQGVEHDRHAVADLLQVAILEVEHQQRQRQDDEEGEPRQRRGASLEEGGRLVTDDRHRQLRRQMRQPAAGAVLHAVTHSRRCSRAYPPSPARCRNRAPRRSADRPPR